MSATDSTTRQGSPRARAERVVRRNDAERGGFHKPLRTYQGVRSLKDKGLNVSDGLRQIDSLPM